MMAKKELLKNYIGLPVLDSYGRNIGRVAGFFSDFNNSSTYVEIETNTGEFITVDFSQLSFSTNSVIYIPKWKKTVEDFLVQYTNTARVLRALSSFDDMDEGMPQDIYTLLKKPYEESLQNLSAKKEEIIKSLNDRIKYLNMKIKHLLLIYGNLKVLYNMGELDEANYKKSVENLKAGMNRLIAEKKEAESLLNEVLHVDSI